MTPLDQPCALLGGISPEDFMRHYWQKKPLLIRGAIPGFKAVLTRSALFALAQRDEVESRLVVQSGPKNLARSWTLRRGPFGRKSLPPLAQKAWSLLVQGVNLYDAKAHDLMEKFSFIPRVRLDDLMISYASDQGGVGPHFDSYDVFLLQAQGVRRWRIAQDTDHTLVKGAELKILARFKPEQEWDLEPGDMLYLPPSYAHEGVAKGECMTYSIGFKSPRGVALAQEVMACMADCGEGPTASSAFYSDPAQTASVNSGEIPKALQNFAYQNYQRLALDERLFQRALGETLTEPKHHVWFQASMQGDSSVCLARLHQWVHHPSQAVLRLDRQTQMLYDATQIFINAESVGASGLEAKVLRRLANERVLSSTRFAPFLALSAKPLSATERDKAARLEQRLDDLLALLAQWMHSGWLHLGV